MYRPAWRMNQTGVRSTGSRRQAFKKRNSVTHGHGQQIARQRDELIEPERLVAQLGAERPDFVGQGFGQVLIPCHDSHWRLREAGNCTDRP
jgi:hypothetical protein